MFCVVFVFSCISQVLEKNIQNPSSSKIRTNSSQEAEKEAIVFILFRCKIVKSRICFWKDLFAAEANSTNLFCFWKDLNPTPT